MRKRKVNLDQLIEEHEEYERRMAEAEGGEPDATVNTKNRIFLGTVDRYFKKLGVAAITLEAPLRIGDIIEIGTVDEAIRQRVRSMQIEREDVESAEAGSSVGIATRFPVEEGSEVFRIPE
jgi:putative protease